MEAWIYVGRWAQCRQRRDPVGTGVPNKARRKWRGKSGLTWCAVLLAAHSVCVLFVPTGRPVRETMRWITMEPPLSISLLVLLTFSNRISPGPLRIPLWEIAADRTRILQPSVSSLSSIVNGVVGERKREFSNFIFTPLLIRPGFWTNATTKKKKGEWRNASCKKDLRRREGIFTIDFSDY